MVDRLARVLISATGVAIVCAVLGIGVFLVLETLPLFQPARLRASATRQGLAQGQTPQLALVDEYQQRAALLGVAPEFRVLALADPQAPPQPLALEGLAGARVSAAFHQLRGPLTAVGTEDGRVWVGAFEWRTEFDGARRVVQPALSMEIVFPLSPGRRITAVAAGLSDPRTLVAAAVDRRALVLARITTNRPLVGPVTRALTQERVPLEGPGALSALLLNESGTMLVAGTTDGRLLRWQISPSSGVALQETVPLPSGVTALAFALGDRSIVVGEADGRVTGWSLVRDPVGRDGWRLTCLHHLRRHPAGLVALAASARDKRVLSVSADGTGMLQSLTSERRLLARRLPDSPAVVAMSPKADGVVTVASSGLLRWYRLFNPHPEFSWRALFAPLWYEGYERPAYVWQSTGGGDDFEPKFSVVPLIAGTLKGTWYALLFAVPVAVLGALFCSQFLDRRLRNPVKSLIELMAALPSVVLGFIAGVVLAPLVQARLLSVLLIPLVVPVVVFAGMQGLAWAGPSARPARRPQEFWIVTGWTAAGLALSWWLGPWIERLAFGGDLPAWLMRVAGVRVDQRNALVVGWVMGFAVIPIIFTMCEDAFSSVPAPLSGASLALGASPWQTAWRVVLPAAGSGVFSAIMVGFGRAVGETMIVLMATGNTPLMDASPFNGFRALSANIAVEMPEAPFGGTLYRVLFICAMLLLLMTCTVNTAAELIRVRLRRRLQGL